MKLCFICNKNERLYYSHRCKDCNDAYNTSYYAKNKDKIIARVKRVSKSKKWYKNTKDKTKVKAREYTRGLLKLGKIKKDFCYDCKSTKELQFHHISYNPNLFIILCKTCHLARHKAAKKEVMI